MQIVGFSHKEAQILYGFDEWNINQAIMELALANLTEQDQMLHDQTMIRVYTHCFTGKFILNSNIAKITQIQQITHQYP